MTTSPQLVLLGSPVAQSKSPVFQNAGLRAIDSEWVYGVLDTDESGVIEAIDRIRSGAIIGANVTMPHKEVAFRRCDRACALATALRAVNTLYRADDGEVCGTNTDVYGVGQSLAALECRLDRAVLLGAGGAAAAAAVALSAVAAEITVINRTPVKAQEMVRRLQSADLLSADTAVAEWGSGKSVARVAEADVVINATALGMKDPPRATEAFARLGIGEASGAILDLIYSEDETPFMALARGRRRLDGATMLVEQGARSFELWTGRPAPLRAMYHALFSALGRPIPVLGSRDSTRVPESRSDG